MAGLAVIAHNAAKALQAKSVGATRTGEPHVSGMVGLGWGGGGSRDSRI